MPTHIVRPRGITELALSTATVYVADTSLGHQNKFLPSKTAFDRQQQLLLLLPRECSLPAATLINCFALSVNFCFVSILAMSTLTLVFVVACDQGIVHII